jgi:hypothetical protein
MKLPAGYDQWSPEKKAEWEDWLKKVEQWMVEELDKKPPD